MVNIQSVFKKYDINPNGSINRAIQNVSLAISEAPDPFVTSNQIISALGCKPIRDSIDAPIIAKCLIEQAILQRDNYVITGNQYTYAILIQLSVRLATDRGMHLTFAQNGAGY